MIAFFLRYLDKATPQSDHELYKIKDILVDMVSHGSRVEEVDIAIMQTHDASNDAVTAYHKREHRSPHG